MKESHPASTCRIEPLSGAKNGDLQREDEFVSASETQINKADNNANLTGLQRSDELEVSRGSIFLGVKILFLTYSGK